MLVREDFSIVRTCDTTGEQSAGCSKRPDFSPAQPWRLFHPPALSLPRQPLRPETRLVPSKGAANYHFIRGGWDDPNCAQRSPPAHLLARRDVPFARARAFGFSPLRPQGSSQTVLHCAHRTSTVLSCAFCEHKGWSGCSPFCSSEAARCASTGIVPAIPPHFLASC